MKLVCGWSPPAALLIFAVVAALPGTGESAQAKGDGPLTASGETLFKQRCAACHTVTGDKNGIGPNLRGVVGRAAASAPGFAYSPAMSKIKQPWTAARLDTFLAGPQKIVPGSRMFLAIPAATDRRAIINYLGKTR